LSCSTHAVGQMPLHIKLIAPDGKVLKEIARG
jgi:NAD-reducing hydrogenase large subunit